MGCFTSVLLIFIIVVFAMFLIRTIATVDVVVADFILRNTNPIEFALELVILATFPGDVSAVPQLIVQRFKMRFNSGFFYDRVVRLCGWVVYLQAFHDYSLCLNEWFKLYEMKRKKK